jgi:hypothetical protein
MWKPYLRYVKLDDANGSNRDIYLYGTMGVFCYGLISSPYYIYAALGSHDYFSIQMPIMGLKHKFYQVWFRLLREFGSVWIDIFEFIY